VVGLRKGAVLVTGASRGLGAAIAVRLAAGGWPVAVSYRFGADAAGEVVGRIRAAGGTAEAFAADVTDETEVEELVRAVARRFGGVAALVVNATGPQPNVAVDDLTWQHHLDQLAYFVKSPTLLTRAVLPTMRRQGHGRIVQIGSDSVRRAQAGVSAYAAAKAAQLALTRSWARELGPDGITVNLVAPGWIPVERHADVAAEEHDSYVRDVPLGRIGTPADVAATVAFLCSDAAGFVTGQEIAVNGGHTL
jgi:NAD(P)-dependent dehydrogenase (short-subunit alcohol dehydrogenase family)